MIVIHTCQINILNSNVYNLKSKEKERACLKEHELLLELTLFLSYDGLFKLWPFGVSYIIVTILFNYWVFTFLHLKLVMFAAETNSAMFDLNLSLQNIHQMMRPNVQNKTVQV